MCRHKASSLSFCAEIKLPVDKLTYKIFDFGPDFWSGPGGQSDVSAASFQGKE
jgi:hypothetical protein